MKKEKTGYPSIDRTHLQGVPETSLHPEIYPLSMLATFLKVNDTHLSEVAIETDEKVYSKEEIKVYSTQAAAGLLHMGLQANDEIAIITPNCFEGIIATLGANAIGIKVAMFEPSILKDRTLLDEELTAHRPKIIIVYDVSNTWIVETLSCYSFLKTCFIVAPEKKQIDEKYYFSNLLSAQITPDILEEIQSHSLSQNDEPMVYLKTSGSTSGKPKTMGFSNRAIFASLIYASNSTGTKTRDKTVSRVLCNAPYQHGYGWMTLFVNLMGGNQVVLVGGKEEDVAKYYTLNPSYIYGTPLTLKQFMESTPKDADLSCLSAFFCAGASMPEEDYEQGITYFRTHHSDCEIRNNYGISEGLCIGTASDGIPHLPGTIGKFYVGPKWLIVDDDLNEVKYNEVGEVIVSAASLCSGYFHDEIATKESFIEKDGERFFRTGDYMSLSEDGYVRFVGRKRRFFFAEGVTDKVNCETIEQALTSLSDVAISAVIVKKDARGIESAKAFIELEKSSQEDFNLDNLTAKLQKALLSYQMPKEIVVLDKIPIMESGKINYKLLETM